MERDRVGVQDRTKPFACLENMLQIGRQSVGDVDHGIKPHRLADRQRFLDTWLGMEVSTPPQASSQWPGDYDHVAGPGSRTEYRPSRPRLAEHRHVHNQ